MDNEPLRELTEDEIKTYWDDGIVCVRNVISMDWIERMRGALDRVLANPGRFGADINEAGTDGRFAFETWMFTYDEDFRDWIVNGPIPPLAAQLLSSEKVHHLFDFMFSKEPHSPHHTLWHQDQPGNPVHGFNIAGTWLPLDVVTHDSGAPEYIRDSHHWNRWFAPDPSDGDAYDLGDADATFSPVGLGDDTDGGDEARLAKYDERFESVPDFGAMRERGELDLVSFDGEPGDLVFQHTRVMHWAPGNYSDRRRRAIGSRWVGDGTTYAKRGGRVNLTLPWDPGLKDGDPFPPDNKLFPQVWPRPAKLKETRAAE